MKWPVLIAALMMLICLSASGQWTSYPGTDYLNPSYPDNIYIDPSNFAGGPDSPDVDFSTTTSGGAPVPASPQSPESLGITVPSDVSSSQQAPTAQENTQVVMRSTQEAA